MTAPADEVFASPQHDHDDCVRTALAAAEEVCRAKGVRLTPIRRRVLEIVWDSHKPIGAYAILEALQRDRQHAAGESSTAVAPPTVYRALDFLREHNLVHRVESLNAYLGCAHPGDRHAAQFLICLDCGTAAEVDSARLRGAVQAAAGDAGFAMAEAAVEISGHCPDCQAARP